MKQTIGRWLPIAVALQFGILAGSAQTGDYLFTGSETTITLKAGLYDITVYGASGGIFYSPYFGYSFSGGPAAEMAAEFNFTTASTLTLLVGGAGGNYTYAGAGGGGGSFVINGSTPLVVAGGGGGGGQSSAGLAGLTSANGGAGNSSFSGAGGTGGGGGQIPSYATCAGAGGGFYSDGVNGAYGAGGGISFWGGGAGGSGGGGYGGGGGGGYSGGGSAQNGGGGGGGGSIIDSSAIKVLTETSGVASPNGSPNGEIIITAVPEPATLALAGLGGLFLLLRRKATSCLVDGHVVYED